MNITKETKLKELLTEYTAYKEKLGRIHAGTEEDDKDKEMISADELKEAYEALGEVIPQMDYDAVEMILDQLKGYKLPAEDERLIKEIGKKLRIFDWDGMEELIKQ